MWSQRHCFLTHSSLSLSGEGMHLEVTCSVSFKVIFPSNKVAIHQNLWSIGCCCILSGGPPGLVMVQAVIFIQLFPATRGHAARKQIDTQFSLSGFSFQRSQGRHLPLRRREFWRYLMRSERTHLCLIFRAPPKRRSLQGHISGLCICFFFVVCAHFTV